MASSNCKSVQHTESHESYTDSKSNDPVFSEKKHETQPKDDDKLRDRHAKERSTKVDAALRFLASVFEEGEASQKNLGIPCSVFNMFSIILCFHKYVYGFIYCCVYR